VPRRESHLHGLYLIDKPGLPQVAAQPPATLAGNSSRLAPGATAPPRLYTSHDIVQLVRRWSGQRRIGHTGTLDPMASGLLVLCLGQATRLVEYYQGHDKVYYAEVTLGHATTTYDKMGEIVATRPVPTLTLAALETALAEFRGPIMQQPPIYSALKQDGESLHYKARRGEVVEVASRPVTIYALDLLDFVAPDRLILRVHCSAGTYIRSLAHDLGERLGTCGYLSLLRRERTGAFAVEDALPLLTLEAAQGDELADYLLPLGAGLTLPTVVVDAASAIRLGYGQQVPLPTTESAALVTALTEDGRCLGILRAVAPLHHGVGCLWKAEKWLAAGE